MTEKLRQLLSPPARLLGSAHPTQEPEESLAPHHMLVVAKLPLRGSEVSSSGNTVE